MKPQQVIIAAGGTGGHIYPALAIAKVLHARVSSAWVGVRGMEERIVPEHFQ